MSGPEASPSLRLGGGPPRQESGSVYVRFWAKCLDEPYVLLHYSATCARRVPSRAGILVDPGKFFVPGHILPTPGANWARRRWQVPTSRVLVRNLATGPSTAECHPSFSGLAFESPKSPRRSSHLDARGCTPDHGVCSTGAMVRPLGANSMVEVGPRRRICADFPGPGPHS